MNTEEPTLIETTTVKTTVINDEIYSLQIQLNELGALIHRVKAINFRVVEPVPQVNNSAYVEETVQGESYTIDLNTLNIQLENRNAGLRSLLDELQEYL